MKTRRKCLAFNFKSVKARIAFSGVTLILA